MCKTRKMKLFAFYCIAQNDAHLLNDSQTKMIFGLVHLSVDDNAPKYVMLFSEACNLRCGWKEKRVCLRLKLSLLRFMRVERVFVASSSAEMGKQD